MDKLTPEEKEHLLKRQNMAKTKNQGSEESPEKPKKAKPDLGYLTQGTLKVLDERKKQLVDKGYTLEYDFNNNTPGILIKAAQAISNWDIHKRIDGKPKGWNTDIWNKQCIKSERERLAIAATWMIAELDRYYYNETLKDGNK